MALVSSPIARVESSTPGNGAVGGEEVALVGMPVELAAQPLLGTKCFVGGGPPHPRRTAEGTEEIGQLAARCRVRSPIGRTSTLGGYGRRQAVDVEKRPPSLLRVVDFERVAAGGNEAKTGRHDRQLRPGLSGYTGGPAMSVTRPRCAGSA